MLTDSDKDEFRTVADQLRAHFFTYFGDLMDKAADEIERLEADRDSYLKSWSESDEKVAELRGRLELISQENEAC